MPNLYATVTQLKGTGALNIVGTAYDTRLRDVLDAVSRGIDTYCNRHFYMLIEVRKFDGLGGTSLRVPDLIALPGSAIVEDNNEDGTFDTVWASADYLLYPLNAQPTSTWGSAFQEIRVNPATNGTQDEFIKASNNYSITGTWGYRRLLIQTGEAASGTWAATGTALVTNASASTIDVGALLVVDDEQFYVRSVATATLTVDRAQNGSTATIHAASNIQQFTFPGPIVEAAIIQAARLWRRKDSAFANEIGMPESGQLIIFKGLDPDVKEFLVPLRRMRGMF